MGFDAAQPGGRALETLRPAPGSRAAGAALQRARKRREALGAYSYGVPSLVSPLVAACYVGQGLPTVGGGVVYGAGAFATSAGSHWRRRPQPAPLGFFFFALRVSMNRGCGLLFVLGGLRGLLVDWDNPSFGLGCSFTLLHGASVRYKAHSRVQREECHLWALPPFTSSTSCILLLLFLFQYVGQTKT